MVVVALEVHVRVGVNEVVHEFSVSLELDIHEGQQQDYLQTVYQSPYLVQRECAIIIITITSYTKKFIVQLDPVRKFIDPYRF